ncbi:MAG TPA: sulfurtransferase-like selenium metabolism protein YedF [Desulfurivibrionaceae bacterium]|nr:sulfurtransferase-like selenium metabolism protein YedF [Desulfurivibrionaceae bacterium]
MDLPKNCCAAEAAKTNKNGEISTVIYLNSPYMGRGDDSLGEKLLAVFLDTLANIAPRISHVVLVNGGVKLACSGSPVLEQLQNLASTGVAILSCGTCLNHFVIKDRLQAGKVSNMMEIVEVLSNSARIINP